MKHCFKGRILPLGRGLVSVAALLAALTIPVASASQASPPGPSTASPTLEELRAGAERFARIFENFGTYPGPFFKGKVTLTPPTLPPEPGAASPLDAAWSPGFSLPMFDSDLTALVRHRGHWVAAGLFRVAPGAIARGVADWDGERWRDLGAGFTGTPRALASDGANLYAAGGFDVIVLGMLTRAAVMRWTGDHWEPLPGQDDGYATALRVIRGSLYVAGEFYERGTNTSYPLARWDGNSWRRVGPAISGYAYALAEHEGHIVVAGMLGPTVPGTVPIQIAELESATEWKALASQDTSYVRVTSLESFGGQLYASGTLRGLGVGDAAVASWDGARWTPANVNGFASALAVSGGKLWTAGSLWTVNQSGLYQPGWLASLEGAQWEIPADEPDGLINALAGTSGRPALAGRFGNLDYRRIDPNSPPIPIVGFSVVEDRSGQWTAVAPAAADGAGLSSLYGNPPGVRLDLVDGALWASGDFQFSRAGNAWTILPGMARWSDGAWVSPADIGLGYYYTAPSQVISYGGVVYAGYPYPPYYATTNAALWRLGEAGWEAVPGSPPQGVFALAVHDGALVVAGRFAEAGGAPAASIARYDGSNWTPIGDVSVAVNSPGLVPTFTALLSDGPDLWVGGSFQSVGNVLAASVARWDGAAWQPAGAGFQGYISVLGKYRSQLVAAGEFYYSGSEFTGGLASFDGTAWHRIGPDIVTGVRALAEVRGSLYVGGYLSGPFSRSTAIARFDGQGWEPLGSGLLIASQQIGEVRSIVPIGDELWVSGRFSIAGGHPAYSVSTWNLRRGSFGMTALGRTPRVKATMLAGSIAARVTFSMDREGAAEIGVFDVRGARVGTVARERFTAGTHEVEWNGRDASGAAVAPGVYFLQLRVDGVVVASGRTVALR